MSKFAPAKSKSRNRKEQRERILSEIKTWNEIEKTREWTEKKGMIPLEREWIWKYIEKEHRHLISALRRKRKRASQTQIAEKKEDLGKGKSKDLG